MRIGLVVEQFDPRRGGLEQWSAQFAGELGARGHEVHVVSGRFGEQTERMPIVAHRLDGVRSRIGFAEAAERALCQLDLDVVHDTGAGWYCDVFQPHWGSWSALNEQKLLMLPRWARPWKRMMIRWLPRYRRFRRLMARQYRNDGRLVMALSRRVAGDFQRFHGVMPENIRLVYNGVDTDRFTPENRILWRTEVRRRLGVDERTTLLLIVAHNFRLKGVPTLLKAVRRLASRGRPVHLAVVGGKRAGPAARVPERRGPREPVTFVGAVDDAAPYYAAADLYVHPTFYDTFSLVVLEALASGLPVVTSRFNGAVELFRDGLQGVLLADPADEDELAARLEPLFEPAARERMGRAARRLAEQHTFRQNVDNVLAVYEEAVRRDVRGRRRLAEAGRLPLVVRRIGTLPGGFSSRPPGAAEEAGART